MAEKLSKKLNETLYEKDRKTIEGLFEFDENLKNLYNEAICNDAQRESIANKELNITYLIEQIVKIKNKHISNEEKVLYQKLYEIQAGRKAKGSVKERIKGVFK